MSKPYHIVIVGSGPAGLAAAIAITKHPSNSTTIPRPLRVTVLELRPSVQTIGGAVNMKPLTLRYLDALGAGLRLRPEGNPASAIDLVAHRTGALLATLWPGVDALRVRRHAVVEALMETALSDCNPWTLRIKHGAKVTHIEEYGDPDGMKEDAGGVFVTYTMAAKDGSVETETLDADVVVGCDGIHSFVRRHVVEPERPEIYSGKCVAYGFTNVAPVEAADWTRADGTPLVRDTTLVQHGAESLLMAYHELPIYRKQLYLAAVIPVEEATGDNIASGADDGGNTSASASVPSRRRDGWAVQDADKQGLRRRIGDMFAGGEIACLGNVIARCDDWFFYPVYMLPEGGRWTKGRVILLGDAAHAVTFPSFPCLPPSCIWPHLIYTHKISATKTNISEPDAAPS